MRSKLAYLAAFVALLVILGGQVSEVFDHWDHTMRSGNDVDYPAVVLAAAASLVVVVPSGFRVSVVLQRVSRPQQDARSGALETALLSIVPFLAESPPALPLRI